MGKMEIKKSSTFIHQKDYGETFQKTNFLILIFENSGKELLTKKISRSKKRRTKMKTKEQKRIEAEERHEKYINKSKKQKLERLNKGKFRAKKEREKLGSPKIPKNCTN